MECLFCYSILFYVIFIEFFFSLDNRMEAGIFTQAVIERIIQKVKIVYIGDRLLASLTFYRNNLLSLDEFDFTFLINGSKSSTPIKNTRPLSAWIKRAFSPCRTRKAFLPF